MLGRFISAGQYADPLAQGQAAAVSMLNFEPDTLLSCNSRKPFLLEHRPAGRPCFSLARLFALCRRMPSEKIPYRIGDLPGDAELDSSHDRYRQGLTLEETLDHLDGCASAQCTHAWIRPAPLIGGMQRGSGSHQVRCWPEWVGVCVANRQRPVAPVCSGNHLK